MALVKKVRKLGARGGFSAAQREGSLLRPQQVPRTPPCAAACPNGTDIRAVLTSIARVRKSSRSLEGVFDEAFYVIAERNPLPAVAARVCPHHCESRCHRTGYDEGLAINQVERFLADRALERALPLRGLPGAAGAHRVAVVGATAAGWSLAHQLARRGCRVTIWGSTDTPGGDLYDSLPGGLVPRGIVDSEIARLLAFGIEFRSESGLADPLWTPPGAESFDRIVRIHRREPGRAAEPGSFVPAIRYGRHLAETVDAEFDSRPIERMPGLPVIGRDRIKFDHYPHKPRFGGAAVAATAAAAAGSAGAAPPLTDEAILAEAERCLSCGACWECDNCYKYCPEQAVVKSLEAGQPYRFKLEFCTGCGKCADECACGYLEMR